MSKWRRKKHRISRKDQPDIQSVGEWSRMLHKSWMINVVAKHKFKKEKNKRDYQDLE